MTPINALYYQAANRPGQVAFIFGDEIWSYLRLATEAESLAQAMVARGLRPGDRVALHMANLPELAVAYYACFRIGAIATPLNNRFKTAELRQLLQRLRPSLYLGQAPLYRQVAAIEPEILAPDARYVVRGAIEDNQAQPWASLLRTTTDRSLLRDPPVDSPAVLFTTSGTTGQPKLVTHTPSTLSAATTAFVRMGLEDDQIAINALPMVHASGLFAFLSCIRFGVPMIMLDRFEPDAVLDAIEFHRGSWMLDLPFMFADLLKCQRTRTRKVDSLRFCLSTGDLCPVELQQEFPRLFGVPLRSVWGSTESMGSLIHGLQPGAVSRTAPSAPVRLVDEEGDAVKRGAVGELLVRGPNVTPGYWTGPGRIDSATFDGWFHTGDLMRQGEEDDLWFVARKKDLIVRDGSNISPVEVERALMAHPAVRDAAVVGIPDATLGQRVAALVQLSGRAGSAGIDDILVSTATQLADYKMPERVKIVPSIPRNALGKIDRKSLLAVLSDATTGKPAVAF